MEDLFAFNNEELARCVFNLKTPAISAVGHETDFTIVDFVADLRAPTPSAAAELVVPNIFTLKDNLIKIHGDLRSSYNKHIDDKYREIDIFKKDLKYNNPYLKLRNDRQDINMLYKDLVNFLDNNISKKSKKLVDINHKLKLLNPLLSLESGYGILMNKEGNIIKDIDDINLEDLIDIKLKEGNLKVLVKEITKGE